MLLELGEEWRWKSLVEDGGILSLRQALTLNHMHRNVHGLYILVKREEAFLAIRLGKLFTSGKFDFTVPAAAMLLALRKRDNKDPVITNVFRESFFGRYLYLRYGNNLLSRLQADEIKSLHVAHTKAPMALWPPEVWQFKRIIGDLHWHF